MEQRRRTRVKAASALALFLVAMLVAAGLKPLGLLLLAVFAAAGWGTTVLVRTYRAGDMPAVRPLLQRARTAAGKSFVRVRAASRGASARVAAERRRLATLGASMAEQLEPHREREAKIARAWSLNREAAAHGRHGRIDEAIERSSQALATFLEIGDARGEAFARYNVALAFARRGDLDLAADAYRHAAASFRAVGDARREAQALANLGTVLRRQGHEEEAIASFRSALARADTDSPEYKRLAQQLRLAS